MRDSNDILTTRDAANILGVSVSTVQKMMETHHLRSWKTPGGHRRTYLADVYALMGRSNVPVVAALPLSSEFVQVRDASYPVASNEAERLHQLSRSNLLDSPPNPTLDRIARLAATATQSPVAMISVLSARRSWFKAKVGLDESSTPRAWALCNYTVMQSGLFTVPDTLDDARFSHNPLVTGAPFIRAYAGVPLHDEQGWRIGALCVIDRKPRVAAEAAASVLADLASMAMDELRREARLARHG